MCVQTSMHLVCTPMQTSCSVNKFKAIYSIERNFKVKCSVMSLTLYFAIFQFFFFSKLYQHTNPSSCFRSFFLLRNACSTGVFCMLTSLLWGWIQDGARLIKLSLLVKIHLQCRLTEMIMASLLKTNRDCFTQGHKSTYQMIHLLWCRHVLWSLQM